MAVCRARFAAPATCSNGLFPRPFALGRSSSESGTCSEVSAFDRGFLEGFEFEFGGREPTLLFGAARRREVVDCTCDSYSTDVLRGTTVRDEVEAHDVFGVVCAGSISLAACVKAVAMLTEVSFTLHFSGLGGEVKVFGPPGREERLLMEACSRCF